MKSSYPSWVLPLVGFAGAVFGAIAITAIFISMSPQPVKVSQNTPSTEAQNTVATSSGEVAVEAYLSATGTASASVKDPKAVLVDWQKPVKISRDHFFDILHGLSADQEALKQMLAVDPATATPNPEEMPVLGVGEIWKQGVIQGGTFAGGEVYFIRFDEIAEMGGNSWVYEIAINASGTKTAIAKGYGDDQQAANFSALGIRHFTTISLAGTVPVTELHVNGRLIQRNPEIQFFQFQQGAENDLKNALVGTSDEGVPLYSLSYSRGCLVAILENGYAVGYKSYLPIIAQTQDQYDLNKGKFNIAWKEGYSNSNIYTSGVTGGCGGGRGICPEVVSAEDLGPESDLIVVGVERTTGDSVYAPKDPETNGLVRQAYDQWYVPSGEKSLGEMMATLKVPIFFWKDAFGRWIKFEEASLVPVAECGKPVIYLYPTSTTKVRVSLPKSINVTVSVPKYPKSGWNVTAKPDGTIISGGKTYGSLYWEGTGVSYQTPKAGSVVQDGSVDAFLSWTLPMYGLNQKESQEFRDFWVPKMTGAAPYYRISFLTDAWSKAAPLSVSPRPQTSIRLFMDWSPLSAPIMIPTSTIPTPPARNGFTLVEWGGTLYK